MGESRTGVPSRRVVVLATPTAQSLEVAGPIEVFATTVTKLREAGRARSRPYEVTLASCTDALAIRSFTSGLTINADCPWSAVHGEVDTLVVSGGMDVWTGADNPALLEWVRLTSQRARRTVSVCTGAFVLAEARLLAGRRVTTHWYFSQKLQEDYPALNVDPEPLFIRDGNIVSAAGVASGEALSRAIELAYSYLKVPEITRRNTRVHFTLPLKERIVREVGYGLSLEGASATNLVKSMQTMAKA